MAGLRHESLHGWQKGRNFGPQMKNTITEDKKWKILSSEYLVQRPWLTARRDVTELPDGRINHEYYVLE